MLKSLYIRNYALIEEMTISFDEGLNIITGETGTGKSIILGALSLILGDRARTDMIREGADKAVIEADMQVPDSISLDWMKEYVDIVTHSLLIRREIQSSGRSRAFVHDTPVPVSVINTLGDLLIDLHGQHEHQALFKTENHLSYLDNFGTPKDTLVELRDSYIQLSDIQTELDDLKNKQSMMTEKQDILAFQFQEIQSVDPKPDEDITLEAEERTLKSAEKLFDLLKTLKETLYEGEGATIEHIARAEQRVSEFTSLNPQFKDWAQALARSRIEIQETLHALDTFVSGIDFDPNRLEQIRERLSALIRLKKKYGGSLEQVFEHFTKLKSALGDSGSVQTQVAELEKSLREIVEHLSSQCVTLTRLRRENAGKLSEQIKKILKELGLPDAEMQIRVMQKEKAGSPVKIQNKPVLVTLRGMDQVEFLISLNAGESPKPLAQIASGGEISRIMLAIKTILADADNIPVLVFDEIDTGISGRIAHVVGTNLKKLAQKHQIICITHLPQIAAMGSTHFSVHKDVVEGRSQTNVRRLDYDQRIYEIAKLIGGEKVTEAALDSAKELLFQ